MPSLRMIFILILAALSSPAMADFANCTIEIEDVALEAQTKASSKQTLEFSFSFSIGGKAQRKHFNLAGGKYLCTLAFFDLDSGTSLSCERTDDSGHTYFQSDRSGIKERSARNNLVFRDRASHFVLDASCK
jgi:hypothetical protein